MSLYLTRRTRRKELDSIFEEVQLLFGVEPTPTADGLEIRDRSGLIIFRSLDLGEPRLFCFFHRHFFEDKLHVRRT